MKKGFTLVEVLIVVVIIAVLASLILPRMLGQSPRAKAAEAFHMIGAIRRGAEIRFDATGSYVVPSVTLDANTAGGISGNWMELGLKGMDRPKNWRYTYIGFPPTENKLSYYQIDAGLQENYIHIQHSIYQDGREEDVWDCSGIFSKDPRSNSCTI